MAQPAPALLCGEICGPGLSGFVKGAKLTARVQHLKNAWFPRGISNLSRCFMVFPQFSGFELVSFLFDSEKHPLHINYTLGLTCH